MKRNKSLKTIGGAIAVLAISTFAQSSAQTTVTTFKKGSTGASQSLAVKADSQAQGKGDRVSKRLEQLQQRLNLTTDQLNKIQAVVQNSRDRAKAAREEAGTDQEAFKRAHLENIKNTDAQIQGVLSAEQRTKYAELKAEMKVKREIEGRDKDND